jgi:hypothetical protein
MRATPKACHRIPNALPASADASSYPGEVRAVGAIQVALLDTQIELASRLRNPISGLLRHLLAGL